jgi:cobalamin synthase
MAKRARRGKRSILRDHGLGLSVAAVTLLWLVLYWRADAATHLGAFYGNATADWLGSLLIVIATKYFYEIGSAESRPPHPTSRGQLARALVDHSLTILLLLTGAAWVIVYARLEPGGKAGEVVGNVVSEWTQVLGLVLLTKYVRERHSKE